MVSLTQGAFLLLAACSIVSARPQGQIKRDITDNCTDITYRVPWTSLSDDEKSSYIAADLCLINSPSKAGIPGAETRWDDLHWPHVYQTIWVHGVGAFLPFHRYYMTVHENLIREECGYTGRMPYWDELADINSVIANLDMFKDEYFGGNGAGTDRCIGSGSFENMTLAFANNDADENGRHCVWRNFSETKLQQAAQANIDECMAISNYTSAWSCWANKPHGAGHGGIGGLVGIPEYLSATSFSNLTTDGRPNLLPPAIPAFISTIVTSISFGGNGKFFLYKGVKLYTDTQDRQKADYPARLTDMGGPNIPSGTRPNSPNYPPANVTDYFNDGGSTTTLEHTLWMMDIAPNVTIGDVMNLNGPTICAEYLDE